MPTNLLGLRTGFIGSNDIAPNDPMNHQLLRSLRNLKPSDWAAWEKVVGDYEAYAERDKSYAKTLSSSHLLAIARIKLPSSVRSSLAMRRKPQISPVNLPQMDAKNFNRIEKAWEQYFRDGGGVEEISALKEDVLREPKQRRGDFSKNVELLLSLLREKDAQRFWDGRDAKTLDISWVKDILSSEMAQRRPFTIEAMTTCIRLLAKIIKFQRSLDDETQSKTVAGEINEFLTSLKKEESFAPDILGQFAFFVERSTETINHKELYRFAAIWDYYQTLSVGAPVAERFVEEAQKWALSVSCALHNVGYAARKFEMPIGRGALTPELQPPDPAFDWVDPPEQLKIWASKAKTLRTSKAYATLELRTKAALRPVLLHGEPGTGKSMGARVAAAKIGCPLVELEPTRVKTHWQNKSSSNFRQFLQETVDIGKRNSVSILLLINECESLTGRHENAGEQDDVVGAGLRWFDDDKNRVYELADGTGYGEVFVVFTCNQLGKIDEGMKSRVTAVRVEGVSKDQALDHLLRTIDVENAFDWVGLRGSFAKQLLKPLGQLLSGLDLRQLKNVINTARDTPRDVTDIVGSPALIRTHALFSGAAIEQKSRLSEWEPQLEASIFHRKEDNVVGFCLPLPPLNDLINRNIRARPLTLKFSIKLHDFALTVDSDGFSLLLLKGPPLHLKSWAIAIENDSEKAHKLHARSQEGAQGIVCWSLSDKISGIGGLKKKENNPPLWALAETGPRTLRWDEFILDEELTPRKADSLYHSLIGWGRSGFSREKQSIMDIRATVITPDK